MGWIEVWVQWGVVGHLSDPTDILGNTRFIDGNADGAVAWDIVAYEFDPAALQLVDISDTGLLAVIRAALNKPAGDITVADMRRLTVLDASRQARGSLRDHQEQGDPLSRLQSFNRQRHAVHVVTPTRCSQRQRLTTIGAVMVGVLPVDSILTLQILPGAQRTI